MSLMDTVAAPGDRPIIATICADAGLGKTSFAATFPKPIFIRAEDGLQSIATSRRPMAFPIVRNAKDLWDQLFALLSEEHDFKTVVIDSVTSLERIFIQDVMEMDGKAKSINQALGGYGAGIGAVAAMHQRVRKAASALNERRGMNVIFIAHADVETLRLPDSDDYQRYSLRLMDKCRAPYVDDVDMVGFIRLAVFLKGEDGERKKAVSTGERELIMHAAAASVSKNRFGITESVDLPEGENPLLALIPAINGAPKQPAKKAPAKTAAKAAETETTTETEKELSE